jgi:hypothetical protein
MYNATALDGKSQVAGVYLMPYEDFQTIRLTSRSNDSSPIPSIRYDVLNSCPGNASYTMDHCYINVLEPKAINPIKAGTCIMINNTHSNKQVTFSIAYAFGNKDNMHINYTAALEMSEMAKVNSGQSLNHPSQFTIIALTTLSLFILMTTLL